jgi:hypothetical protein
MVIYDEKMKKLSCNMKSKTVQISKTTHVSVMGKTIQLIDVVTANIINEIKLERDAIGMHFGGNRLVCVFEMAREYILRVWKVENSLNLIHLKDVTIGEYNYEDPLGLQVDEHFIAVRIPIGDSDTTFNLVSMNTFQVERSLSCDDRFHFFYDGGYLFLINSFFVRILDVASGTFLHDMPVEPPIYSDSGITRVNSNYFVVAGKYSNSKLYVYDLECLKDTDADPTHLLLTTIDLECDILAMMMNETRIVCLSDKNMYVVDLKPVDRLRCPESC